MLLFRLGLLLLLLSFAGWTHSVPLYLPDKVVLIYGQVESVNSIKDPASGNYEVYLFVRRIPSGQPYFIHLAPQWYVKNYPQKFNFAPGDRLGILGAQFTTQLTSQNLSAARLINYSKNSETLSLRNPSTGSPVWKSQASSLPSMVQNTQSPTLQQSAPTGQIPSIWNNQAAGTAGFQNMQQPINQSSTESPVVYSPNKSILMYSQVERVNTIKSPIWGNYGFHLFVRQVLSGERYFVHVAPQWYAENHPEKFNFAPGDLVAILGTLFSTQLTPNNIQAATIINYSKNFTQLFLRDPNTGAILWNNQPKNLSQIIHKTQQQSFNHTSQQVGQIMQDRAHSATDQVQVQFVPSASPSWLRQTTPHP
jgi:hypothetical protein